MADFRPPPGTWRNDEKFSLFFKLVTFADFSAFTAIIRKCTQKQKGFPYSARMRPAMPSYDTNALRLQRQIRRAVAETCGPAGIRELSAQDETTAYAQPSSAVSNSLKPERSPPRRHNARTSERCPCVVRWDAVVTASCEAFCEEIWNCKRSPWESQPQPAVKPSARLVFFYPYISGSARAFFPGGGQDGSQNGRFSTPSRKMAK